MNIREKLIKLRDDNNLSQQEFADMLNVSRQTVSRWEAGRSLPSSAQIFNICRVFGLDANELLSNSQDEAIPDGDGGGQDGAEKENRQPPEDAGKINAKKINLALLITVGVLLVLALAGLITTIVYAVKDGMYDTSATVWIVSIPANTPMIILSVFLALFIIALTAILVYLFRRKGR